MKSSLESHTTGYDKFRMITNAQLKYLQGLDSTKNQMKCEKFELKLYLKYQDYALVFKNR